MEEARHHGHHIKVLFELIAGVVASSRGDVVDRPFDGADPLLELHDPLGVFQNPLRVFGNRPLPRLDFGFFLELTT